MRSGKSKAIIDNAGVLFMRGLVTGVVVVAPNVVHQNWLLTEFPKHCGVPYDGMFYTASKVTTRYHKSWFERVCRLAQPHLQVFCINAESARTENGKKHLARFLKAHRGKLMLVVDEAHMFRTPGSGRTRVMRAFAKHCTYRRILSGTISSNTPLAVWAPFELLQPGALGFKTFREFKSRYAVVEIARSKGGQQFEKIVRYQNLDELQERMAKWSSVVTRQDAGILDPNGVERRFELTAKQRDRYTKLKDKSILEGIGYDGGARLTKLQQITSGWYIDENDKIVELVKPEDNPRLQALIAEIVETPGKVVVWCRFRPDIEYVMAALKKAGVGAVKFHGSSSRFGFAGMTADARAAARLKFMRDAKIKVFVGQPQTGGTGIDLSAAKTVMWYSHVHDLIDREQASERATVVGGEVIDVVDFIADRTVDSLIRLAHKQKTSISDELAGVGLAKLLQIEDLI
jgi:hypothetical protein